MTEDLAVVSAAWVHPLSATAEISRTRLPNFMPATPSGSWPMLGAIHCWRVTAVEAPMRKKRDPETEEQRKERFAKDAQRRTEDSVAEDEAIDAMIQRSLKLHGP